MIFAPIAAAPSMFIDSITVIMFLAAVTAELARLLKISPIPMILAEIFCANPGGSATMCGAPPNIIIGTAIAEEFGLSLYDKNLLEQVAKKAPFPLTGWRTTTSPPETSGRSAMARGLTTPPRHSSECPAVCRETEACNPFGYRLFACNVTTL